MTQLTDEELFAICGQNKGKTWLEGIRTIIAAHEQKLAAEYQQSCEPVAYAIFALMEGEWVPQYPIRFTRKEAEFDMVQYTRDSVLEIRPLYTRPQQDARDAERLDWVLSRVIVDERGIAIPAGNTRTQPEWAQQKSKNIAAIDAAIAAQKGGA